MKNQELRQTNETESNQGIDSRMDESLEQAKEEIVSKVERDMEDVSKKNLSPEEKEEMNVEPKLPNDSEMPSSVKELFEGKYVSKVCYSFVSKEIIDHCSQKSLFSRLLATPAKTNMIRKKLFSIYHSLFLLSKPN